MNVVWRNKAREDFRNIARWLSQRNQVAALRVARALLEASESLASRPEKGRPGLVGGTRELSIVPPYVIVYQVDTKTEAVVILRIWHSAQSRD